MANKWQLSCANNQAKAEKLVDLVGIEPTTSSMPWKRAPSCATGPQLGHWAGTQSSSILAHLCAIVKRGQPHTVAGLIRNAKPKMPLRKFESQGD